MKELRAGIVGCGAISTAHIQAYHKNGIQVTALADVSEEALRKAGEAAPGAERFSDAREMAEAELVDLVSICNPPAYHEDAAVLFLGSGVHVLCEKPFAHTLESARRIAEAARASDARFMCGFRHRFFPAILELKDLLKDIGPLVFFQNVFCAPQFGIGERWFARREISGGGALIDTASHSIDLFRFLVGEVAEEKAVYHRHLDNIEVEDTAVLSLKAENGAVGSIICSWVAGVPVATVELVGQEGRAIFDYSRDDEVSLMLGREGKWRSIPVEPAAGFTEEIAHFAAAIRGETEQTCTVDDALRSMEIIDSVTERRG